MTAAAIAAAALIAGCGSSSSGAAGTGSDAALAQAQQGRQQMIRFADCMRSHGLPDLPSPTDPRDFKNAFDPQSPAFQSAYAVCHRLQPGGGPPSQSAARSHAQMTAMLAFARCLRDHGFPTFPDPTRGGEMTHEMLAAAGINLHQPAVVQAADACVGLTHGVITKAGVARFVAGR